MTNPHLITSPYLVKSTSQDGATGIAVCNGRARYLYPMLKELVIPAFIGRDVRELESLVNEVYIFSLGSVIK